MLTGVNTGTRRFHRFSCLTGIYYTRLTQEHRRFVKTSGYCYIIHFIFHVLIYLVGFPFFSFKVALGEYQPIRVKERLEFSLLRSDTGASGDISSDKNLHCTESLPNTPRDDPHAPVVAPTPGSSDPSIVSVDMDMTMDDL